MKQHHLCRAVARGRAQTEAGADPKILTLKEWIVHTQCAAHYCHNSLKWAMWQLFPSLNHMDELWRVFSSLKNSSNLLHEEMGQWVALHLAFEQPDKLPSEAAATV
eukprot:104888-Lingulodinium_polyedra.AAC.1